MSRPMFRKVLIANRGEIACRVMRTCRRMGIHTVAVFSEADRDALHVRLADEAILLGPAPPAESYLHIERILQAARETGAEAIHPGYGFLSENDSFADACREAGVVFIGPPADAIRAMGSKAAAKARMHAAGVPLTPGYHGEVQETSFLQQQAEALGYPVLIKASAGGGGKGMRLVTHASEFAEALASCKREARASFGEDRVLIERYIQSPRHIEVQVFADTRGQAVSLFERDCSVQRRHQKVLEEAPAPGMTEERRRAMGEAACRAAQAVGYVGAGTVEFIVDPGGHFFFMEMNTRLQVEHPVTEMITGLDLVEWQLRVACGEPLPKQQAELGLHGHAIEARVYAEDPAHGFLPSTGRLTHYREPTAMESIRIDAGVEEGDAITPYYDPLIAKLIAWGNDRTEALARLATALAQFEIAGLKTNVSFLQKLVASPSFREARLDTALIERENKWLSALDEVAEQEGVLLAALAVLAREAQSAMDDGPPSPWKLRDGWRLNGALQRTLRFLTPAAEHSLDVQYRAEAYRLIAAERVTEASVDGPRGGPFVARLGAKRIRFGCAWQANTLSLFWNGHAWTGTWQDPLEKKTATEDLAGSLLSPMPGRITALSAAPGQKVAKGAPLLVLEAMKMEYTVAAPSSGHVERFLFRPGEQVPAAAQLLIFHPDTEKAK